MATKAENLRPGMKISMPTDKPSNPSTIRTINEVCYSRPEPHVHLVTTNGTACYGFKANV